MVQTQEQAASKEPHVLEAKPAYLARELTGGGNIATIMLDSKQYVLRITRQDKLILTK